MTGISDGFGRMTEGFAIAFIEEAFKNLVININKIFPRARSRKNGNELEIDFLNLAKNGREELVHDSRSEDLSSKQLLGYNCKVGNSVQNSIEF